MEEEVVFVRINLEWIEVTSKHMQLNKASISKKLKVKKPKSETKVMEDKQLPYEKLFKNSNNEDSNNDNGFDPSNIYVVETPTDWDHTIKREAVNMLQPTWL